MEYVEEAETAATMPHIPSNTPAVIPIRRNHSELRFERILSLLRDSRPFIRYPPEDSSLCLYTSLTRAGLAGPLSQQVWSGVETNISVNIGRL